MYYALTNDQEIYLILCELVSDPYIAENILNFNRQKLSKNVKPLDSFAAAIILQRYLDRINKG